MDLVQFSATSFWAFLQVFARVSALFATAPVFGSREIPTMVKIGLSTVFSLVLLPLVTSSLSPLPGDLLDGVSNLVGQTAIGLAIGLAASLLFVATRVGGDVIDYQMGFTQASTFNPQFNETVSPIANLQYRYAMVIFLLANGHWLLVKSLLFSFERLPAAQILFQQRSIDAFTTLSFQMLLAGLQIAAPAAAVLLVTDISFAFLNRAMPQMQVYYVGAPVKIGVGLAMVAAVLPIFTAVVVGLMTGMPDDIYLILRGLHR